MGSLSLPTTLAADAGFNPGSLLLPALLVLMMVFMFTRSRKAQQQAVERRASIVPGSYVLSASGLYGTVVSKDEETNSAVVRIAEGVEVTMHLGTLNPAEAVVKGALPAQELPEQESGEHPQERP